LPHRLGKLQKDTFAPNRRPLGVGCGGGG
jgi:hypothetical protein